MRPYTAQLVDETDTLVLAGCRADKDDNVFTTYVVAMYSLETVRG